MLSDQGFSREGATSERAKMKINYDHSRNIHGIEGPESVFRVLLSEGLPSSVLDVGCGTGTWLRAALKCGLEDVIGIDGVEIPIDSMLLPPRYFICANLTKPIDLGRQFGAVLCLEVAEHLPEDCAPTLVESLIRHSDCVIFSAACPNQTGQNHINCQWPEY